MKGLTMALGAIALCFAGTTVYFARELHEERADHQATAAAAAAAADEQPLAAAEFPVVQASTSPAEEVSPTVPYAVKRSSGNAQPSEEEMRQMAIEESRKFLEKLSTPAGRAKALEEMKLIVRARPPGLDKFLHMDAEQYSMFINLLAERTLALRESATRCNLDKNCRHSGEFDDWTAALDAEIAAQFGHETVERYHWYERTSNELLSTVQREVNKIADRFSADVLAVADSSQRVVASGGRLAAVIPGGNTSVVSQPESSISATTGVSRLPADESFARSRVGGYMSRPVGTRRNVSCPCTFTDIGLCQVADNSSGLLKSVGFEDTNSPKPPSGV